MFGLVAAATAILVWSRAVLWADGSYYLYQLLDSRAAFAPFQRLLNVVLQQPVLAAARFIDSVSALTLVFGAPYALIPLLALTGSFRAVRGSDPSLFLWPSLGICLGTLPMQVFTTNEALITTQLAWPPWLLMLTDSREPAGPWWRLLVATAFAGAMALAHPLAGPLLAAMAFASTLLLRARRAAWGAALGVPATVSLLRSAILLSPYEREQLSLAVVAAEYRTAVAGIPLLAFLAFALAGALALWSGLGSKRCAGMASAAVLIAIGGSLLLYRACDPALWRDAIQLRKFISVFQIPFLTYAAVDRRRGSRTDDERSRQRQALASLSAVVFLLVVTAHSMEWRSFTSGLLRSLSNAPHPLVPESSAPWLAQAPLKGWTLPVLAIILQGRAPTRALIEDGSVQDAVDRRGLRIAPWDLQPLEPGFFDFSALAGGPRRRVKAALVLGWRAREHAPWGSWVWTDGKGTVRLEPEQAVAASLRCGLKTELRPARVRVRLDGREVGLVALDAQDPDFVPLQLDGIALGGGPSLLTFEAEQIGGPALPLALSNLEVWYYDGEPPRVASLELPWLAAPATPRARPLLLQGVLAVALAVLLLRCKRT